MADIHAVPEAIRSHGDAVAEVAAGVLDGAAAGIRSIPDLNFGLIPGPTIYPPAIALFTIAETAMTALAGLGGDLALALKGLAELYELTEEATKALITKAGQS